MEVMTFNIDKDRRNLVDDKHGYEYRYIPKFYLPAFSIPRN